MKKILVEIFSHLLWTELCPHQNSFGEVLAPTSIIQKVTIFVRRAFKDIIKVNEDMWVGPNTV